MRIGAGGSLVLALFLCVTSLGRAQEMVAETAFEPRDLAPLLSHVRESERERLFAGRDLAAMPVYDLHLSVDGALRGFGLRETIDFTNDTSAPIAEVVLRIFANAITQPGQTPPVRVLRTACVGASCTLTQPAPSVLRFALAAPLAPGARMRIELDLQGTLGAIDAARLDMMAQGMEAMQRMDRAGPPDDYGLLASGGGIACMANFYAVLAYRRSGAWDVDDHGTHGDLGVDRVGHVRARIVVPEALRVVSSGVEVQSRPVRDTDGRPRRREIEVSAGLIRDFALLLGEAIEHLDRDVNGVTVRSFFGAGHTDRGREALRAAAGALEVFEARFGPYPYTELDVVEAPVVGGAGGVEFSSLVTVSTSFYRPVSGLGALGGGAGALEGALTFVTAHEVAHQWWYGLVGSDMRLHPVTDEALAQWSAMLFVEEREGAARAQEEADRNVALNYRMMRMMGHADGAADREVGAFGTPVEYAGLVYGKAPYFYRELRALLGDEAFFSGLRSYAAYHAMSEASPSDIVRMFARGRFARRVRALARRWLDEAHGDDDLGGHDASTVMGAMLPPELRQAMDADPAMRAMMEQVMGMMMGGGGLGELGGGEDAESIDPAALQQLMQMLGGGGLGELGDGP